MFGKKIIRFPFQTTFRLYQALLFAMGVGDDQMIPYAATVCMEIYRNTAAAANTNAYEINVWGKFV